MIIQELESGLQGLKGPVAVDTEFHAEHRYIPKLLLVQLRGADGQTRIVDPKLTPDLALLGQRLSGMPLLVHAATHDLRILAHACGLQPGPVLDPQVLAGFAGLGFPRSLGDLCREVLGVEVYGGLGLTDWNRRPLSPEQLAYAADDVQHLQALVDALQAKVSRMDLATEAIREKVTEALKPVTPELAWRRFAAAPVLDGRSRIALRRLAAWREREARKANQPVWQIASDAVLVDLSRRRPTSTAEMARNRRFSKRLLKRSELLELVADDTPFEDDFPIDQRERARLTALDAALAAWAAAQEVRGPVAARLLLPQPLRLELALALLRGRPTPIRGWRAAIIPALSQLVIELQVHDIAGDIAK